MEKIIKKATGKKSNIYSWATIMVVGIGGGLWAIFQSAGMENYFGVNDDTKSFLTIVGVMALAFSVVAAMKTYTAAKMFITVCEDKVYGVAGNGNMMLSKPFDVAYSEITKVECKMSTLSIQCRAETYFMMVEDANEVCELIKKQMDTTSVR